MSKEWVQFGNLLVEGNVPPWIGTVGIVLFDPDTGNAVHSTMLKSDLISMRGFLDEWLEALEGYEHQNTGIKQEV